MPGGFFFACLVQMLESLVLIPNNTRVPEACVDRKYLKMQGRPPLCGGIELAG